MVLEVGAGLGVLTVALARAARTVHAIEMDRRLEAALADAIAGAGDVRVHWGDAMKLDLGALDPPPDGPRRQPAVLHRDAARGREPVGAARGWSAGA